MKPRRINLCLGRLGLALIAFLVLFSLACERPKKSDQTGSPSEQKAIEVIDGDTFIMANGQTVRILGINTPERGEPFYQEATGMLKGLVLGKQVTLRPGPTTKDRYGRLLGEVFVGSINVGLALLRSGLAEIYLFDDDAYLLPTYCPVMDSAVNERLGIWSMPPPVPERYYVRVKGSYRFHRPLCPGLNNARRENMIVIGSRDSALSMGLSPCRICRP